MIGNSITIIGNMVRPAEIRTVGESGTKLADFTVAVNEKYKNEYTTTYFQCTAWGKLADVIEIYTTKGSTLAVQGSVTQNKYSSTKYKDDSGNAAMITNWSIRVEGFRMLDKKNTVEDGEQSNKNEDSETSTKKLKSLDVEEIDADDDDLPF